MNVIDYCKEEVRRQQHDINAFDGFRRVQWMLNAWCYALGFPGESRGLTAFTIEAIAKMIEPDKNIGGFRTVEVRVGTRICPPWSTVYGLTTELCSTLTPETDPIDFYKRLMEIHPFVDGNGRTGKIVLNWLNGTLLDPIFPPHDLFGASIENP